MLNWPNPFIEQRADPYILHHEAILLCRLRAEYDRLALRRADSLEGLRSTEEVTVWRKPDTGPMSQLIWAPELHSIDGSGISILPLRTHRRWTSWACSSTGCSLWSAEDHDPLTGKWVEKRQIHTPFDTFALDATTLCSSG